MAAPSPALSVIVPTRDTRELTVACLASLPAAGLPESAEILVVDDASDDGTAEAIRGLDLEVRLLRNPEPLGFTGAVNRGLGEAQGELILLLNSDTELAEGSLYALVDAFREPGLGVAGAQLFYPDGRSQWSGGPEPGWLWLFLLASGAARALSGLAVYRWLRDALRSRSASGTEPSPAPSSTPAVTPVGWVTGAAMALRREVIEQVGPLDGTFRFYAQDLDLCVRAREAGWTVAVLPGVHVLHHHGASIGRARPTVHSQQLELLWTDLLRWARKARGARWARGALAVLSWGARLRIVARSALALALVVPRGRREAWRQETAAYRDALAAVRAAGPGLVKS